MSSFVYLYVGDFAFQASYGPTVRERTVKALPSIAASDPTLAGNFDVYMLLVNICSSFYRVFKQSESGRLASLLLGVFANNPKNTDLPNQQAWINIFYTVSE